MKTKQLLISALLFEILIMLGCYSGNFSESINIENTNNKNIDSNTIKAEIEKDKSWFFPPENCPTEIFPTVEKEVNYLAEGCSDPLKCLNLCKKQDGNACYSLALFLQQKESIEYKYSEALFFKSCEFGIVSGCTNFAAGKTKLEDEDSKKLECAANTFKKSCEFDDPWGCTMYASFLAYGVVFEQNLAEAKKALSKSCKYGDEDRACTDAKELEKEINDAEQNQNR